VNLPLKARDGYPGSVVAIFRSKMGNGIAREISMMTL
jgi:hypothetical protein